VTVRFQKKVHAAGQGQRGPVLDGIFGKPQPLKGGSEVIVVPARQVAPARGL